VFAAVDEMRLVPAGPFGSLLYYDSEFTRGCRCVDVRNRSSRGNFCRSVEKLAPTASQLEGVLAATHASLRIWAGQPEPTMSCSQSLTAIRLSAFLAFPAFVA